MQCIPRPGHTCRCRCPCQQAVSLRCIQAGWHFDRAEVLAQPFYRSDCHNCVSCGCWRCEHECLDLHHVSDCNTCNTHFLVPSLHICWLCDCTTHSSTVVEEHASQRAAPHSQQKEQNQWQGRPGATGHILMPLGDIPSGLHPHQWLEACRSMLQCAAACRIMPQRSKIFLGTFSDCLYGLLLAIDKHRHEHRALWQPIAANDIIQISNHF